MENNYENLKFEITKIEEFKSFTIKEWFNGITSNCLMNGIIECKITVFIENINCNNIAYIRKESIKEYIRVMKIEDKIESGIKVGEFI